MAAENELKGNDEMLVDSSSSEEDTDMLSGGNDSDDDDNVKNAKIEELQKQVDVNPYNYDHQIELLTVLRASGELDLLRNARNNMNKIFPLPPDIWKQWIEDEKKLASSTEEREAINQLFGRALEDYNSPDIWLEYVQFSIGDMQAKGANYVREVFEKALTAVGLHVTEANLLWTAYAEFEVAVLAGFQPKAGAVPTPEQNELVASQTKKVINVLKRHLSLPLEGIDESFEEYKSFVEEVDPTVQSNFRKAQEKLNILMPFEEALEDAKGPRTDAYKAYIKHELKGADPSRIQCIFERALIENCLIPDFWLKYGKYLDQDLRSRTAILKMYNRAVRNCPWSSDLWLLHIRALERFRYSEHDVIKDEFNKALKCNQLPEAADYLKVWQGYCDYMRRRIDWDEEDQTEKIEDLRKTFQQALDYLTQYYGKDGDPNCNLLQYWARIEAKFCKNMEKARENWNVVMQQGFGNQAQMWLEYFYLERSFGTHKHCRKILQRALNSVTDWPDYIVEAFITFEREEGTLEQYDQAMEKCDAQMARLAERKAKAAEKEALLEDQRNQQQRFKAKAKRPHQHEQMFVKQEDASPKAKVKRERVEPVKEEEVPKKEYPIKSGVAETVDKEGFKVPNPPSVKAPVAPPPGYQARKPAPPPGYKPDVEEPPDKRQKVDEHEETSPTKQSEEHSKRTVFVSNLDFHVKEADLTPLFMPYGDLKDIRLIKAMNGKSKGFGYVEFKEEGPVKKALQLDRTTVSGRPMFVSECKDKTERQVAFKYETKLEKKKLFIKNLPFSITKEALEKIFTEHGNVKDIRMVTYRSGQFKGLAYVEYDEEESASKAIMKTDGLKIGDFEISVAISNPPARKPQGQKKEESNFTPTLGGGKKEADRGGRAKTMLSFQPRSLQAKKALPTVQSKKPAAASKQTESENGTETDSSKKASLSNADFRSMLMK